jgi:N-methylhydantoinase B
VSEEVKNGIISIESAKEDYSVIVDPKTYELDEEATHRLRKGIKL